MLRRILSDFFEIPASTTESAFGYVPPVSHLQELLWEGEVEYEMRLIRRNARCISDHQSCLFVLKGSRPLELVHEIVYRSSRSNHYPRLRRAALILTFDSEFSISFARITARHNMMISLTGRFHKLSAHLIDSFQGCIYQKREHSSSCCYQVHSDATHHTKRRAESFSQVYVVLVFCIDQSSLTCSHILLRI